MTSATREIDLRIMHNLRANVDRLTAELLESEAKRDEVLADGLTLVRKCNTAVDEAEAQLDEVVAQLRYVNAEVDEVIAKRRGDGALDYDTAVDCLEDLHTRLASLSTGTEEDRAKRELRIEDQPCERVNVSYPSKDAPVLGVQEVSKDVCDTHGCDWPDSEDECPDKVKEE